jgi:CRP-like cAMP-binding protein
MKNTVSLEEVRNLYAILRKIDFLSAVTVEDIDSVIEKFTKMAYPAGKKVIKEGDTGLGLYIIKAGRCSVYVKKSLFNKKSLAEISAGDFFGEMSLVFNNPVSATVEALENCEIYFYSKKDFLKLVSGNKALENHLTKLADKRRSENVLGK